jgi:hypothetical protein
MERHWDFLLSPLQVGLWFGFFFQRKKYALYSEEYKIVHGKKCGEMSIQEKIREMCSMHDNQAVHTRHLRIKTAETKVCPMED